MLFRSVEGLKRAKRAFRAPWYKKLLYTVCFCCKSKRMERIIFHNKFLRLKPAVEPDLILWQNFGVSKKSRCIRTIIFLLFTLLLLIVCFFGIL